MTSCLVYLDLYLDESPTQLLDLYLDKLNAPGLDIDFVSLTDTTKDFTFKELIAHTIVDLYLCNGEVVELSPPIYKTNFAALRNRLNKGDIFIDLEGLVRLVVPCTNILLDFSVVYSYLRRAF